METSECIVPGKLYFILLSWLGPFAQLRVLLCTSTEQRILHFVSRANGDGFAERTLCPTQWLTQTAQKVKTDKSLHLMLLKDAGEQKHFWESLYYIYFFFIHRMPCKNRRGGNSYKYLVTSLILFKQPCIVYISQSGYWEDLPFLWNMIAMEEVS